MLPSKIRIGYNIFPIEYEADLYTIEADNKHVGLAGQIQYSPSGKISLREGQTTLEQWQTLFHECIHGFLQQAQLTTEVDLEAFVDVTASGFMELCRNNPKAIYTLLDDIDLEQQELERDDDTPVTAS